MVKSIRLRFVLAVFMAVVIFSGQTACSSIGNKGADLKDGKFTLGQTILDFGSNEVTSDKLAMKTIKANEEDQPEGLASDLYELTIDLILDKPVTLSLPFSDNDKSVSAEAVPMLGIGRQYNFENGTMDLLFTYLPAEVHDNRIIATFIPAKALEELKIKGASVGGKASDPTISIGFFSVTTRFEKGGHFIVTFPRSLSSTLDSKTCESLLQDLEAVYQYYLDRNYVYAKRSNWPMDIYIQKMKDVGAYSYGWYGGADSSKIYLNRSLFEGGYKRIDFQMVLAHEFFHFVQMNYASPSNDCLWLDEATATYFESLVTGKTPSIVQEYRNNIFKGVFPEENTAAHGYARQPLIKYLVSAKGEDFIRGVYEAGGKGTDWIEALKVATGEPAQWAADFYENLVGGRIGEFAPYTMHADLTKSGEPAVGKVMNLKVPTDDEIAKIIESGKVPLLGETTVEVAAYGAQVIALTIDQLDHNRLNEDMDPVVTVSAGAEARVFDARGKDFTVYKAHGASITLKNFKKGITDQHRYLIVVTGLHSKGSQTYAVKVELPPYITFQYPESLVNHRSFSQLLNNLQAAYIIQTKKQDDGSVIFKISQEESEQICKILQTNFDSIVDTKNIARYSEKFSKIIGRIYYKEGYKGMTMELDPKYEEEVALAGGVMGGSAFLCSILYQSLKGIDYHDIEFSVNLATSDGSIYSSKTFDLSDMYPMPHQ